MKSEFLPTDNRGVAAGGDRGRCDETSESRWKKKNLPRKNDRNVDAVGRSRMDFAVSSRVRACSTCTHTCVHIYRAASPPRIRTDGCQNASALNARDDLSLRVKLPRCQNRCPFHALHAIRLYRTNCRLWVRELFRPSVRLVCERLTVLLEPVMRTTCILR